MKKGLIGVMSVAILGYVGTSIYFGSEAESQLKKSIKGFDHLLQTQTVNVPSAPKMNLVVKNYDRGLLSSSAKLGVKLDLTGVPIPVLFDMKRMSYDFNIKINHGPFIFPLSKPGLAFVQSKIAFPAKLSQKAKVQLTDDSTLPQFDLNLFINFDESIRINTAIPAFTLKHKQFPGSFTWKGMTMVYDLSKALDSVKGQGSVNGMVLKSPFGNASVAKMHMNSDIKAADYGLWVGDNEFNVPSIKVSTQGQAMFDLSKWQMKSFANMNSGLVNIGLNMSLERAMVMGKTYGPANIDFSLKNLDAKTFSAVQTLTLRIKNSGELAKEQATKLRDELNKILPKMVTRGAELSLKNVRFQMPEGQISAGLNIKVPMGTKVNSVDELADYVKASGELSVPMVLVDAQLVKQASRKLRHQQRDEHQRALQAQINAGINHASEEKTIAHTSKPVSHMSRIEVKALAEQKVKTQVKKLIDNQLLIKKGANYVFKFKFDKGHLFVNGKPFTPDMLEQ